jgi:hypothetical protein
VTVHVISVGLSVFDALNDPYASDEDGRPKFRFPKDADHAINRAKPRELLKRAGIGEKNNGEASDWLIAAFDGGDSSERAELDTLTARVRPGEWPLNMSAEIETFGHVQRASGSPSSADAAGFPLSEEDIAVLVCSDTPAGLLAGMWNALAIVGGDLGRVRYVPDVFADKPPLAKLHGHVVLARVTGLDASDTQGFEKAMGGLGVLARHLFASGSLRQAEEFRFYLSGGYKAAIPYLIGMAEAIRSVDRTCLEQLGKPELVLGNDRRWPVKAFMLHEAAPAGALPIELPLRRLVARAVRKELTEWQAGKRVGIPDHGLLEGYAYEVGPGPKGQEPCELTPFGEGLRALFGLSREGHGG